MSRTILIVDDDRELCDLVGELLRGEGFEVEAHHSGAGPSSRPRAADTRSSSSMSCCPAARI
jgi:DNA-binding response OmpR family regulator